VLLMMRCSRVCVHSAFIFLPISGHFHSNPNFVDLPMTPLLRRFPPSPTLCRLMLARSNGPVLDAQRTFNHQTATVLRGAYLQPLSRALTRPHALTRTVASLRLATAIYA